VPCARPELGAKYRIGSNNPIGALHGLGKMRRPDVISRPMSSGLCTPPWRSGIVVAATLAKTLQVLVRFRVSLENLVSMEPGDLVDMPRFGNVPVAKRILG
jgi:hypothetical protein